MWTYTQSTGKIQQSNDDVSAIGYSGFGSCRNMPSMQNVSNIGCIPRGKYRIGIAYDHAKLGPLVMNLEPLPGTNTFDRSLFRIHGDNAEHNASHGCIILSHEMREAINASNDRVLEVVE